MSVSALTRRYAKALVELGVEQQSVEPYGDELASVKDVLSQHDLLRQLLDSPTLDFDKKEAMLADLCKAMELSEGMTKFLGRMPPRCSRVPHRLPIAATLPSIPQASELSLRGPINIVLRW